MVARVQVGEDHAQLLAVAVAVLKGHAQALPVDGERGAQRLQLPLLGALLAGEVGGAARVLLLLGVQRHRQLADLRGERLLLLADARQLRLQVAHLRLLAGQPCEAGRHPREQALSAGRGARGAGHARMWGGGPHSLCSTSSASWLSRSCCCSRSRNAAAHGGFGQLSARRTSSSALTAPCFRSCPPCSCLILARWASRARSVDETAPWAQRSSLPWNPASSCCSAPKSICAIVRGEERERLEREGGV